MWENFDFKSHNIPIYNFDLGQCFSGTVYFKIK